MPKKKTDEARNPKEKKKKLHEIHKKKRKLKTEGRKLSKEERDVKHAGNETSYGGLIAWFLMALISAAAGFFGRRWAFLNKIKGISGFSNTIKGIILGVAVFLVLLIIQRLLFMKKED